MDALIAAFCVYMVYSNIKELLTVPFGEWALVQYLLALVSLGLSVVAVLVARRGYKRWKAGKQGNAEEGEAQPDDFATEEEPDAAESDE